VCEFAFGAAIGVLITVSTLKESVSTIADACAQRNAFHESEKHRRSQILSVKRTYSE